MPTAGLFVTCIRIGVECKCNILGLLTKKVLLLTTPKAPTANACGLAGGTPWGAEVGEAGDYTNICTPRDEGYRFEAVVHRGKQTCEVELC